MVVPAGRAKLACIMLLIEGAYGLSRPQWKSLLFGQLHCILRGVVKAALHAIFAEAGAGIKVAQGLASSLGKGEDQGLTLTCVRFI